MKGLSLSINYILGFLLIAIVIVVVIFILKGQIGSGAEFAKSAIGGFT